MGTPLEIVAIDKANNLNAGLAEMMQCNQYLLTSKFRIHHTQGFNYSPLMKYEEITS